MSLVEYEQRDDHIVVIRMNRPDRKNAFSIEMVNDLAKAWVRYSNDDDAWIAILTGVGDAFSTGMDMKEVTDGDQKPHLMPEIQTRDPYWNYEMDKPVIAAVNGWAMGGGTFLTVFSDFRIAADTAVWELSEVVRGGTGGQYLFLFENFPYSVACELACGLRLTAKRAYEIGFVNKVVPRSELMDTALDFAKRLLTMPPLALYHQLRMIREIRRFHNMAPGMLLRDEADTMMVLRESEDMKEAIQSFVEKRKPVYKRR